MSKKLISALFLGAFVQFVPFPAHAQNSLDHHVVANGAADVAAGGWWLRGTLGQPVVGGNGDLNYTASIGFWRVYQRRAVTGIGDSPTTPGKFHLFQNFPNPVRSHTAIRFYLPEQLQVRLQIFDVRGRLVGTLVDEVLPAGEHVLQLRRSHLAGGLYWYRLDAGAFRAEKRFIVIG